MEPFALSIDATRAALGGVGRNLVYGLIAAGKLEKVKLGNRSLVTTASIRKVVEGAAQ